VSDPMRVKSAAEPLPGYEHSLRRPELIGSVLKYDNREFLAGCLDFFLATAQNPLQKPTAPEVEPPSNPMPELLAEGYSAGLDG
jgi:hypothetical protein